MSKLIDRRAASKTKKSTTLVSVQTAKDAIQIGNSLLNAYMADGIDDPNVDKLSAAVDDLEGLLTHWSLRGVTNVEELFDDAISPETARRAKNEVDMIAQLRREQRPGPTQTPAQAPVVSSDKAAAAGNDPFVTDRDEAGNPKAPEKAEVPRIAAKKKEAQPEVAPPPAVPAPTPAAGGGSLDALFAKLPSDFLADLVKKLTSLEGFEQDKDVQAAVENLAGKLQARPVEAAPAPAGTPAAAPTASAKKAEAFGGKQAPPFGKKDDKEKKDASVADLKIVAAEEKKVAVTPPGSEDVVKALKDEPGVDNPWAVAWSMYNKGDKMSSFKAACQAIAKIAGAADGSWSWDQATGDVLESGGRTPEIAEAHSKIDEAPAKLDRPATVLPSKLAGDMSTAKAVKEAEKLGNELKKTYLDAKAICTVNDSRPVREFVESIFRASDMADEAIKTLNKQVMQEESEAEAAKIKGEKGKKSSSFKGLSLIASEEQAGHVAKG